jgi:hypothetical protein
MTGPNSPLVTTDHEVSAMNPLHHLRFDDVTRRAFVSRAAQTFLGVSALSMLPRVADAAVPFTPAKSVIYIYLNGGMSHIDTLDPKTDSDTRGEFSAISTSADGVQITDRLPMTAKVMDRACLFRSVTSKQGAHERGQYLMRTSYNPIATIRHPGMGAWALKLGGRLNPLLPGYVVVDGDSRHPGAGFLDSTYAPLSIGNPEAGLENATLSKNVTPEQFQRRLALADTFDQSFRARYPNRAVGSYTSFYADAVKLMNSGDLKAFDLSQETQATRDRYGSERFGQGLLLARRLVQHGVRFIEVGNGGWDTHQDNFDRLSDKCEVLDQGLSALIEDLTATGLLDETLVVLATEFGRSPKINGSSGRDHHPKVFSCMMAGGPLKRGYVHGSSDAKGHGPASDPVEVGSFNATIAHALGLDVEKEILSPNGRPFTVANKAKPVTSVFA